MLQMDQVLTTIVQSTGVVLMITAHAWALANTWIQISALSEMSHQLPKPVQCPKR